MNFQFAAVARTRIDVPYRQASTEFALYRGFQFLTDGFQEPVFVDVPNRFGLNAGTQCFKIEP
jgi:hypothetical protein